MAKLLGIAFKKKSKAPMEVITKAEVKEGYGIIGTKPSKESRQITVLSSYQWERACREAGQRLNWTTRRANLYMSGYSFCSRDVGKLLRIGKEVVLEVIGETKPCSRMDEACSGLKKALTRDWRGGVTCRVIKGGTIEVGDEVWIERQ